MQWHGYDYIKFALAKTLIVKRCAEPACHEMSQMNLTPVLEIMNNMANDPATAVCGHRGIEVNRAMGAICACESARNSAFEWLGALLAKWRDDTRGLGFALLAEIFASSSPAAAQRAYRRVKKRGG